MLICGSPMGWLIPLRMPKSAGLNRACAVLALDRRLKPNRASLTAFPLKVCVSFSEKNCLSASSSLPKPGMVLPRRSGSWIPYMVKA